MNLTMQLSRDEQLELLARIPGLKISALRGCSAAEIREIVMAQQVPELPKSYSSFLEFAGKSTGEFLLGTDMCYPLLKKFKADAIKLAAKSSGLVLPGDAFVFAFHQGYSLVFFRKKADDDEQVFAYTEGDTEFTDLSKSFSEWLRDTVAEHC